MARLSFDAAALFLERFPRYLFDLPSWQGRERPFERPVDLHLPLASVEVLYLYGIGDGSAALAHWSWLKEKSERRLVFLEPDGERIAQFLSQPQAEKILPETQIEIFHCPPKTKNLLDELARRYPVRGVFVAPGHELTAKERRKLGRLEKNLLRKTAWTHANFNDRLHCHILLSNLRQNARHMHESFYANRMGDAFRGVPAIICGAGPSLEDSIEELKKLEERALIIAGGSAIAALSSLGVLPHFAVAIDPNPDELLHLQNGAAFEAPLIYSSRLYPGVFSCCNGPFGYLRTGMGGIAEMWLEEEIGLTEPIMGGVLPRESFSVTTLCAALAIHWGCNPILFDGLDLSYTRGRRYAEGIIEEIHQELPQPIDRRLLKKDRSGQGIESAVRYVMEAAALSKLARRQKNRRWVNCTRNGLRINGIEDMPLAQISRDFLKEKDLRGMIHQAIKQAAMPEGIKQRVEDKLQELRESLDAVLRHLSIIVKNDNPGRRALSEIEMKDEIAFSIFFFDIAQTLQRLPPDAIWQKMQEIALQCRQALGL